MKLIKRVSKKLSVLALALMMTFSSTTLLAQDTTKQVTKQQEVRLQDDFYAAVNKEWLAEAKIRPGTSAYNNEYLVNDVCTEQINTLFQELLKNESKYAADSTEKKMINLYNNYLNTEARNKQGIEPIKKYLDQIDAITKLEDITKIISTQPMGPTYGIMGVGVSADLKDSSKYSLYMPPTTLLIGNADYYNKPDDNAKKMQEMATKYLKNILGLVGHTEEEATKMIEDAYKFEKLLTPSMIGLEEQTKMSNYHEAMYNPYTVDELEKMAPNLHIKQLLKGMGVEEVKEVIVQEPKWLNALNSIYTEENVGIMKSYLEIKLLCSTVGYLSEDFFKAAVAYNQELTGTKGTLPAEERALNSVSSTFTDEIGKLYVEKYFPAEAKKDVEELVSEIIVNYKKKLEKVDWMSEETKKNAIKKLDNMGVKIGYPEEWTDYSELEIKSYAEGGSLFDNVMNMNEWSLKNNMALLNEEVDKSVFMMAPQTVNACYVPNMNDITFPAAILQPPYYDVNRSREANLGAIGAVIGHEISHAFDTAGAKFDEKGDMKNWWIQEDYTKFNEKSQKIVDYYNTVKVDSGKTVNGALTVGENIADITSISCMLDILKGMENPDYKAFFESWAITWREITTPEYEELALQSDVHSPNKVRANVVLQQFQEFYDTYGIKEGDGMYVKPEDRIQGFLD